VIAGLVVGTFGLRETVVGYVGYVLAVSLIGGVLSLGRTRAAVRLDIPAETGSRGDLISCGGTCVDQATAELRGPA